MRYSPLDPAAYGPAWLQIFSFMLCCRWTRSLIDAITSMMCECEYPPVIENELLKFAHSKTDLFHRYVEYCWIAREYLMVFVSSWIFGSGWNISCAMRNSWHLLPLVRWWTARVLGTSLQVASYQPGCSKSPLDRMVAFRGHPTWYIMGMNKFWIILIYVYIYSIHSMYMYIYNM